MKTILVIEDNRSISENLVEMLELEGYQVLTAFDGKSGVELAKSRKPDIILSDVMMPEMNGNVVFEVLRKDSTTVGIPFVFITSSVEKKAIQEALDKGADGYIKKPFEAEELYKTIETCLEKSKSNLH